MSETVVLIQDTDTDADATIDVRAQCRSIDKEVREMEELLVIKRRERAAAVRKCRGLPPKGDGWKNAHDWVCIGFAMLASLAAVVTTVGYFFGFVGAGYFEQTDSWDDYYNSNAVAGGLLIAASQAVYIPRLVFGICIFTERIYERRGQSDLPVRETAWVSWPDYFFIVVGVAHIPAFKQGFSGFAILSKGMGNLFITVVFFGVLIMCVGQLESLSKEVALNTKPIRRQAVSIGWTTAWTIVTVLIAFELVKKTILAP